MREMAGYQRLLDDIPSKAELIQYQKRFVELYNQMSFKYTETKHQYALYNTLSDTKSYMEKEISLLNSIHDGYEAAIKASTESKRSTSRQINSKRRPNRRCKDISSHIQFRPLPYCILLNLGKLVETKSPENLLQVTVNFLDQVLG